MRGLPERALILRFHELLACGQWTLSVRCFPSKTRNLGLGGTKFHYKETEKNTLDNAADQFTI
jgi:hypothetical protein